MKWVVRSFVCYSNFFSCDLKVNDVYLNFNLPLNIEIHLFLFYNPLLNEFMS